MAWNEPGGKNDNDPWGGGDQGPPDLDEAFRKFKEKFSKKNGGSGSGGSNGGNSDFPEMSGALIGVIFAVIFVLWFFLGFYQIDQQEKGVILRFGKFLETVDAGLHWNPPLIDTVMKENVTKVRSSAHRGLMLTVDDNIVEINLSVQYTVNDAKAFKLETRDPELSLQHASESALRHAVGSAKLDQVLTDGKVAIAQEIKDRLQRYLDDYKTGIFVASVNIEDAQPPAEVQEAFDDVIRAKEDEARAKNEAETYMNKVVPESKGKATRMREEAEAYKEEIVARAEGEAKRFTQLLEEYEKAPKVTRQRLYIDTMQRVMTNSSKVMVDVDSGNIMYLPLDKLLGKNDDSDLEKTFKYNYPTDNEGARSKPSTISGRNSSIREGR